MPSWVFLSFVKLWVIFYFFEICVVTAKSWLQTHERQKNVVIFQNERHSHPEKVWYPPVEGRSCYIRYYATEQLADCCMLVLGELRYTNASSARCTDNWPDITAHSALISTICFWALPGFPHFPALFVISHLLSDLWWNGAVWTVLCWVKQE